MFKLRFFDWCCTSSALPRLSGRNSAQPTDFKTRITLFPKKSGLQVLTFCFLLICLTAPSAHGVLLVDWIFNVDNQISDNVYGDPMPADSTLDDGLGTMSLEVTGAGVHNVIGFFDYEILQAANTYYNEYGETTGTPGAGQSWEIDEIGWNFGDVVDNVYAGGLDNTNGMPFGVYDDMSFAMGWDFSLLDGDIARIDYIFTDEMPSVDFYLTQIDPDAAYQFYFYSELVIESAGGPQGPTPDPDTGTNPVPEPGTAMLVLTGGLLTVWTQRRRVVKSANQKTATPETTS